MRDIRYICSKHGPFVASATVGPGHPAPKRAECPKCNASSQRLHRRKPSGMSISVRAETYERLALEADRTDTTIRALVEEYTKDCK